jgi:hypothetical protein
MKTLLILALLIASSMAAHTLCGSRRDNSKCVQSITGTTCPECPLGKTPMGCTSAGNGFPGIPQCAAAKPATNDNELLDPDNLCGGKRMNVMIV